MSIADDDFALAVNDLQSSTITDMTLEIIRRMVDLGLSTCLMAKAVHTALPSGQEKAQTISRIQKSLEMIAQEHCSLACILMSDLWGFASSERVHDVCDGIDLWLWQNDCVELRHHLNRIVSSEQDPDIRRHFLNFIERQKKRTDSIC